MLSVTWLCPILLIGLPFTGMITPGTTLTDATMKELSLIISDDIPPTFGPCTVEMDCNAYEETADECGGYKWDQDAPCPNTRNCALGSCKVGEIVVSLYKCDVKNTVECDDKKKPDKNCGETSAAGKCNVTSTPPAPGTGEPYECEGGACDIQTLGSYTCHDRDSCK